MNCLYSMFVCLRHGAVTCTGCTGTFQTPPVLLGCEPNQVPGCFCLPEDQIPHGFPTIDMGPQLKVVERTRTATMLCAASGNPDPEIHWFKDFLPVDIGSSNGRIKQLRSGRQSSRHSPALQTAFWLQLWAFWSCDISL